jgi:hypothetical protein
MALAQMAEKPMMVESEVMTSVFVESREGRFTGVRWECRIGSSSVFPLFYARKSSGRRPKHLPVNARLRHQLNCRESCKNGAP